MAKRFDMDIGSVVDINIEGTMTSCILIDIKHNMIKTQDLYFLIEQYIRYSIGSYIEAWPRWKELSSHGHIINPYILDAEFLQKYSPGYEMLIGDRKAWLFMDPNED